MVQKLKFLPVNRKLLCHLFRLVVYLFWMLICFGSPAMLIDYNITHPFYHSVIQKSSCCLVLCRWIAKSVVLVSYGIVNSLFLVSQVLVKEGELNKLSRKQMQPRMFFLVFFTLFLLHWLLYMLRCIQWEQFLSVILTWLYVSK